MLGALVRIPFFAAAVLLALHVVQTLDGSYAQSGALSAIATLCVAVSGPWRGRMLDRFGLRRTILPSIVVTAVCWSIAPFVDYVPLLILASIAGLFAIPIFTIVRLSILAVTTEQTRQPALALESVTVESAFMIGPVLGVAATTLWSTTVVLFSVQVCVVLAGVLLWVLNPPLRSSDRVDQPDRVETPTGTDLPVPRRSWMGIEFIALCVGGSAAISLLAASELTFVSAIREFDAQRWLGVVLAIWGFGSLLGGLIYGTLRRPISPYVLLAGLGITTVPMAFANGPIALAITGFFAGLFCAPTIVASVDQLGRIVPDGGRGEAIGWHGSAMTSGSAIGASLAGITIDAGGYAAGFGASAAVGIGLGIGLALLVSVTGRRRALAAKSLAPV